jgi:hypothetical protein
MIKSFVTPGIRGGFKAAAERIADNPIFLGIGLFSARDIRRMLDVEFASELLILAIEGVTNKKDFIDDTYARFEEDFPRESEYEGDVNTALSLIRSILSELNTSAIKTKSNFYSVFGACLNYLRSTKRAAFQKPDAVSAALGDFLNSVRNGDPSSMKQTALYYFEAVSRAASDRARRKVREEILSNVIQAADQ